MRKRKFEFGVGEKFRLGGKLFEVFEAFEDVKGEGCLQCGLEGELDCWRFPCIPDERLDGKNVYFVEVKECGS